MPVWTKCYLTFFLMMLVNFTVAVPSEAGTLMFYAKGGEIISRARVGLPETCLVDLVADADDRSLVLVDEIAAEGNAYRACRRGALCC